MWLEWGCEYWVINNLIWLESRLDVWFKGTCDYQSIQDCIGVLCIDAFVSFYIDALKY